MKIKNVITMKSLSAAVVAGILILAACTKSNDVLNSNDTQNVNSESVSDSYANETSDMTNSVVANVTDTKLGSARESGVIGDLSSIDIRLTGATITVVGTGGKTNPQGTITIDFGTGKTDPKGVVRKGKIIITYSGRRWAAGSSRIISYSGYSRNNVVFDDNMTFTLTNTSTDSTGTTFNFHHVLAGGKLTFPDNTTILRTADFNVTLNFIAKTVTLSASSAAHSATGTTRAGKEYTMDINTALVYKADCLATKVYIPVGGEKTITAGLVKYVINYGDGTTCDNTVTITVGGKSATITVNADGN